MFKIMFKILTPNTAIRIQTKTAGTDSDGVANNTWADLIAEDILVEWTNIHGGEIYQAAAVKAQEPARLRLWYLAGVDRRCRIKRVEDNAIFEIINVDDVKNRHQQLEVEVKRYLPG